MNLLPHNQELCQKIIKKMKKHHDICIVQGTGGGKSFILMYLIITQFKDKKIAIVTPTRDIQDNIKLYKEFKEVHKNVKFFTNHYFNSEERIDEISSEYDVVVVDEVHHIGSDLYGQNLRVLKDKMVSQEKYFLGLTATPIRSADKVDVRKFFSAEVTGYGVFDFVQMGLMPQIEYLICEKETIEQAIKDKCREVIDYESSYDLLRDIIESNNRNKWLCYFSSVKDLHNHRKLVKELFPDHRYIEIYAGSEDTSETFKTIGKNEKVVISSVSKLLEGIHLDKMEGVLLFRKVTSLNVFEQILGRLMSIGAKTSPIFVDCTSTASKLLSKILQVSTNNISNYKHDSDCVRDIIYTSLSNTKFFDITRMQIAMDNRTFVFRGKAYPSFIACCREFGFPFETVYSQCRRNGMTKEEALEYYIENGIQETRRGPFMYEGECYDSVKACCEAYGISMSRVKVARRELGMSHQDAITYVISKNEPKIEFRGKKYKTHMDCCKEYGVNYGSVMTATRRLNISFQESMEHYLKGSNRREPFEFQGKIYKSKVDCFNELGLKGQSVINRSNRLNVPIEDSIEYFLQRNKEVYVFNGVEYTSFSACCKSLGFSRITIKEIAKKENVSLDKALQLHYNRKMKKDESFIFNGIKYNSFKECCEHLNLRVETVVALKNRKNCSHTEAINLAIENKKKNVVLYKGQEYTSLTQCCLSLGICSDSVRKKAKRLNVPIEDSIEYFLEKKQILKK